MANSLPRLRSDLKFNSHRLKGKLTYTLKDPDSGEYYRFSKEEYLVAELIDGKHSASEIARISTKEYGMDFTEEEIQEFMSSLKSMDLLERSKEEQSLHLIERRKAQRQSKLLSKKGSILYRRFPVVDPDVFFDRVIPYIGFFWSRSFAVLSTFMMVLASGLVLWNIDEVQRSIHLLYDFQTNGITNLVILWCVIFTIIGIHELGHGLTCKYYGGEVHEMGILLLFFQPCFYCNVSDAWTFPERSKRLWVTMAGGYIEYFIGSVAAFVWLLTGENFFLHTLSFQVMMVCSLSTLLFNYNPLIKLDGYYALSDLLGVPNLKQDSLEFAKAWWKEKVFGVKNGLEIPREHVRSLLFYGTCSMIYMTTLMIGVYMMARGLLESFLLDIGILISLVLLWKLFGSQLKSGVNFSYDYVVYRRGYLSSNLVYAGLLISSLILVYLLVFHPFARNVKGPVTLEPYEIQTIRARVSGILDEVQFQTGDVVRVGQEVVAIKNQELVLRMDEMRLKIRGLELRGNEALGNQDVFTYQKLKVEINKLKRDLEVVEKQVENLSVKARVKGHYSGDELLERVGTQMPEGARLGTILDLHRMIVDLRVKQAEIDLIKPGTSITLRLHATPFQDYQAKVIECKVLGEKGPVDTYYAVKAIMENPQITFRPGMTGLGSIEVGRETLLQYAFRSLKKFLRLDLFL